jgi:hypothetical protein
MGWPIDPALAIESRRGSFVYSRAKIGYYWENACWHPLRSSTVQGQRQWRFQKDSNWRTLDKFTGLRLNRPAKRARYLRFNGSVKGSSARPISYTPCQKPASSKRRDAACNFPRRPQLVRPSQTLS